MLADTAPRGLRTYLEDEVLQMPARYALAGSPPLVVDPKNKVAYAPAGLGSLEAYSCVQWRMCDWQPLTTTALADVRATQSAHSYERLVWLDVLLHSAGRLGSHLDPGGTYRLTRWLEIEYDLSRYFRIASAMLKPLRLDEIAGASGAAMTDVFDAVNAYDAIGLVEWQPRPPRDELKDRPSWRKVLRRPLDKG